MRISDWSSDVCSSDLRCVSDLAGSKRTTCENRETTRIKCANGIWLLYSYASIRLVEALELVRDRLHDVRNPPISAPLHPPNVWRTVPHGGSVLDPPSYARGWSRGSGSACVWVVRGGGR